MSEDRGERQQVPFDWWALLGPVAGAILGVGITLVILDVQGVLDPPPQPVSTPVGAPAAFPSPLPPSAKDEDVMTVSEIAESVVPSIVTIITVGSLPSTGSGVVYSEDGYIITNHHVVDGGSTYRVEFSDGSVYDAVLVGTDALTDLAVLDVARDDAIPITPALLADLRIGEPAVAVGNPLGLTGGPSVTAGVISALDRTLSVSGSQVLYGLIQTDAPITRGSSGGALVNARGRLLGITTAIGVSDVGAEGLGFAVPVDLAVGIVGDLIEHGLVRHGLLGIQGETAQETTPAGATVPSGAAITRITKGAAIAEAGGRVGDVIVALDGRPIGSIEELIARLRHYRAEQQVRVTVLREGSEVELDVTLGQHGG